MALSAPRNIFGVHSVSPYSRTDRTFYGIIKVLKGSSLSLSQESVELMGGSQKYAWAVEDGAIKAEMSLKFSQFEDFMFTLFLGVAPTQNSAESSGNVSTLANFYGSSVKNNTTGIASALALSGSEANLKFGKYTVVAVSSSTVDVYCSTDVDFARGSDGSFSGDTLKIAAAQTITASTATNITTYGFKLTGGSGTIGMTVGDSATFEIRPANTGSSTVTVGAAASQTLPEFGAIIIAQRRGNSELFELDCFRCKASGMPIGFEMNAWAEAEVKVKAFYDSAQDGVFAMRAVKGT
jgi:hypothetical protein